MFALLLAGGCVHHHLPWNAPGIVDVKTPPKYTGDGGRDLVERPEDPGERMVAFTYGAFTGGGVWWDHGAHGGGTAGIELSLHRGESPRSHYDDDFWIFPLKSRSVNLGMTIAQYDDHDTRLGAIYAEAQQMEMAYGVAGGWAFEPSTRRTGPQVTLFFADLYVRADYFIGEGPQIMAGMIIKLPVVWVWSR